MEELTKNLGSKSKSDLLRRNQRLPCQTNDCVKQAINPNEHKTVALGSRCGLDRKLDLI